MFVDRIQLPMATSLDCDLPIVKRGGDEAELEHTFILNTAEIGVEAEAEKVCYHTIDCRTLVHFDLV